MNTYIGLFVLALVSSLVLTPLVRRLSAKLGWFDTPRDDRRVHDAITPRIGGLAIVLSVLIALSILPLVNNLVTQSLLHERWKLIAVLIPALFVLLVGLYDDIRGAGATVKFTGLVIAGTIFFFMGGRVENLSLPFLDSIHLPVAVSYLATIFWITAVTNAFNLIDGVDGLAAGAGLFSSLVVLVVSLMLGHPHVTVIALVLSGALIGFLRYNFNPASIFLGDSGSLFVGFTLAAISLQGAQKASTAVAIAIPLMAFGLPVVDTAFSMVRRFISRKPIFQGDREHIHHMLLARGWSQRRVVFVLYAVCAALGLASLLFVNETSRLTGLILLIVGSAVVLGMGRLRYHEVDEVRASMKRNFGERRLRAGNHLHIRRATRAMSKAGNLEELFNAVQQLLQLGEFSKATVMIGRSSDWAGNERALERENGTLSSQGIQLTKGMICWTWRREDFDSIDETNSKKYWSLRLPLTTERADLGYINLYRELRSTALLLDINYVCNLFQREMAHAVERVLAEQPAEPKERELAMTASYGD